MSLRKTDVKLKKNEDQLLFTQIKKGNKQAFDTLFRKYYTQLVRFSIGYLHNGVIAEEMVQDVFIKVWENAARIDIDTSLLAYLYRSVRNQSLNYIKHLEIKKKYEKEQLEVAPLSDESAAGNVNLSYFKKALAIAVSNLPEKCRQIFEMAKFEGLSYDEIAEYLQVSGKTVENQMGIALKKLRESLSPHVNQIFE